MTCQPEARDALRSTARALRDRDSVVDAEVFDPADTHHDQWVLEVVLDDDRVGNAVLDELAGGGLDLELPAESQAGHAMLVATA